MHKCKCRKGCTKLVKNPKCMFARGHNREAKRRAAVTRCADPNYSKKQSKRMKQVMADMSVRKKISESTKASYKRNPDRRIKASKATKACWRDPDYRKKTLDARKVAQDTPKFRALVAENSRRVWKDNIDRRLSASKHMKLLWSDPEYKQRIVDSQLLTYAVSHGKTPSAFTGKHVVSKKAGKIICHGVENESVFVRILDSAKAVKKFKKDYPRIPYRINHRWHTYFPDFYVKMTSGDVVVIELLSRGLDDTYKAKFKYAERYCTSKGWEFVVIRIRGIKDLPTVSELVH